MLRPTFVPTTIPTSTTAASTRLPSVHINKAFTPNSGQYGQHNQRRFQPKRKTYTTKFAGCLGCQADPKSQLNIIDQVLYHDESTCLLLNNSNIRDNSVHEASKQNNAKNPPQDGKPKKELEYTRKSPHLTVMPSPNINSILIDPPYPTDNTEEDEEDNEE
eukprot:939880-Ditylum_brightwellii.AAC.1